MHASPSDDTPSGLTPAGPREFIALSAFLMASIALAVDMMLPAMDLIALEFQLTESWQKPAMILGIFAGLMVGQWIFGPLSDAIGRKPSIQLGLAIFLAGTLVSLLAENYNTLILGRVIQGFGAASARIVTQAMIRDRFSGTEMARVMSFVMTVFILVPVFAPMLGQGLLFIANWHWLFGVLGGFALLMMVWVGMRQPETLTCRRPFSFHHLTSALLEVFRHGQTMRYTLAAGVSFGGLLSYLSAVQPIFQNTYQVGAWFAPLFGVTALAIAASSITNAALVRRFGMQAICRIAFTAQVIWSGIHLVVTQAGIDMGLIGWLAYVTPVLFFMGLTFANLQSVALEPMGHIAGSAATVIGSLMTAISLIVGLLYAHLGNQQAAGLILTFFATGLMARILIHPRNQRG